MEDKKLSTSFEDSQKKNEEFFQLCNQIIAENDIDVFMKDIVPLLKKFKNETLASYVASYTMLAVAQAVKQTAEEQLKS